MSFKKTDDNTNVSINNNKRLNKLKEVIEKREMKIKQNEDSLNKIDNQEAYYYENIDSLDLMDENQIINFFKKLK